MKKSYKIVLAGSLIALGIVAALNSCSSKKNAHSHTFTVVNRFDINKYVGKWYEVARIDFKHEKDLKNVTAEYRLKDNGKVEVINKGYNYVKKEWEEANGKAKFNGPENEGALKVSFFGPFYSEYNVVMMEPDYHTVLIFGESTDYLWILSREKSIPADIQDKFMTFARHHGYDIKRITWTIQDAEY